MSTERDSEILRHAAEELDRWADTGGRPWHPAVMHSDTSKAVAGLLLALARAVELSGLAHHPEPLSITERALTVAHQILNSTTTGGDA